MSDDNTLKLRRGKVECWRSGTPSRRRFVVEQDAGHQFYAVDLTVAEIDAIHKFAHEQVEKEKE